MEHFPVRWTQPQWVRVLHCVSDKAERTKKEIHRSQQHFQKGTQ